MTVVGTAAASLVLLVCLALAAVSGYIMVAPNSNTEIRPRVVGASLLAIFLAISAGMVMALLREPVGTYFNAVGVGTVILVGVLVKYGRK